ncbi:hypothetical protein BS47DRAFT_1398680 [Hydnum rufescens UP504]|uniref:Uncharacterized protein n=1 Tax=Hydnum rufescens UP504 TaxID=1448309 RepID=A0A9P6DQI3_9AGAM|nr:hypothetical protein BS47DRAFT_1398680 [Hydnum rufescens UP504]
MPSEGDSAVSASQSPAFDPVMPVTGTIAPTAGDGVFACRSTDKEDTKRTDKTIKPSHGTALSAIPSRLRLRIPHRPDPLRVNRRPSLEEDLRCNRSQRKPDTQQSISTIAVHHINEKTDERNHFIVDGTARRYETKVPD